MAELGLSKSSWGFDPRIVPNCIIWVDAADTRSITRSGNNVLTIRNKAVYSDLSAVATTRATTGSLTLNGLNLISVGSDVSLVVANDISYGKYRSIYLVAEIDASRTAGTVNRYTFLNRIDSSGTFFGTDGTNQLVCGNNATVPPAGCVPYSSIISGFYSSSFLLAVNNGLGAPSDNNGVYLNGTSLSLTNSLPTFTSGTARQFLGGNAGGTGAAWRLGELLVYAGDDNFSSNQRRLVEGYLANKWGLASKLPSTHPYRYTPPFANITNPLSLTGCVLWLDAADRSTITLSGSNISQWSDKSGLSNDAVQATTSNQPVFVENVLNRLPVVRFSGPGGVNLSTTRFLENTAMAFPGPPYSIFIVARATSNAASSAYGYNYALKASRATDWHLFVGSLSNSFTTFAGSASAWNDTGAITGGTQPTSNWTVFSITNDATTLSPYIQGSNRVGKTGTTVAATGYSLGDAALGFRGQNWNGDIAEVLVFNRNLVATGDNRIVEGYLAWKWAISSNLITTHPYLNTRLQPAGVPYPVTQTTNLVLWLDGTDPCGNRVKPANGVNVLSWFDKSGNNNNMTAPTGTPTYDAVNNAIKLGGATALRSTNPRTAGHTAFYVYTNYNGGGPIFSTGGSNVDGFWPNNYWDTTLNRLTIARQDGTSFGFWFAQNNTPYPLNRRCMVTVQYSGSASGSTINGYLDASLIFSTTTTGTITRTYFQLGARSSTSEYLTADYNEVMYFTSILPVTQRQAIEGYLAWKWNLVQYLPSNHPYKKVSP